MALRKNMPITPGSRPDPAHETTYQASRGGWHRPVPKPVPGTPGTPGTEAARTGGGR
ncbi:hypothetical protein [Streptomyces jumonjinensis]|uniref:hypothetical protein n=1 Tax=Streptomyces jumonjinensis TaxID=1945 RepID=UPI0012950D75|nr:hypothetical protein [Streptomyces jumonjinensis]